MKKFLFAAILLLSTSISHALIVTFQTDGDGVSTITFVGQTGDLFRGTRVYQLGHGATIDLVDTSAGKLRLMGQNLGIGQGMTGQATFYIAQIDGDACDPVIDIEADPVDVRNFIQSNFFRRENTYTEEETDSLIALAHNMANYDLAFTGDRVYDVKDHHVTYKEGRDWTYNIGSTEFYYSSDQIRWKSDATHRQFAVASNGSWLLGDVDAQYNSVYITGDQDNNFVTINASQLTAPPFVHIANTVVTDGDVNVPDDLKVTRAHGGSASIQSPIDSRGLANLDFRNLTTTETYLFPLTGGTVAMLTDIPAPPVINQGVASFIADGITTSFTVSIAGNPTGVIATQNTNVAIAFKATGSLNFITFRTLTALPAGGVSFSYYWW